MEQATRVVRVAIVGLGRVGGKFLKKLIDKRNHGIEIVAAAEKFEDAPGVQAAKDYGIRVFGDGTDVIALKDSVDIIFDLTGNTHAKSELRLALAKSGNMHTVIAPEVLAYFIWEILTGGEQFPTRT
jgi:predicted dehydrogenase